uniref:Uncharacterized protein MANES_05G030400 n=1 Tax=Rhizophora mucronata TaxID=61149 RepID=A0A2P2JZN3_RHIMU
MASSFLSFAPLTVNLNSHRHPTIFSPDFRGRINRIRCNGETPTTNSSSKRGSEPENALLKLAWYGSELLGIAASFFRSPASIVAPQLDLKPATEELEALDRATVVNTIKEDFQRSYFVTGCIFRSHSIYLLGDATSKMSIERCCFYRCLSNF